MSQHTFEVTEANFQTEVADSTTPVLIDFWAEWCGPCKMIAPAVDEIAKKYTGQLRVGKLDVDSQPDIAEKYGIQGIPTLILFQSGRPVAQIVGYRTKDQLDATLAKYLQSQHA